MLYEQLILQGEPWDTFQLHNGKELSYHDLLDMAAMPDKSMVTVTWWPDESITTPRVVERGATIICMYGGIVEIEFE